MRSVNFRDSVLWPIAYKLPGLDPEKNFETSQAYAIASYINASVRRTYDAREYGEWTNTRPFRPTNHMVGWDDLPSDYDAAVDTPATTKIGKVLAIYVVNPRNTDAPVDTPFDELSDGIHVGFDHGTTVWIEYLLRCPQFTAREWESGRTYKMDNLTYSPVTGECYKSRANGNINNDPTGGAGHDVSSQVIQEYVPGSPGFDGQNKIMSIELRRGDGMDIPDPPPNGAVFIVNVQDVAGNVIATDTETANGTDSLASILTALQTVIAADPDLSTFVITLDTDNLTITLEDASDFGLNGTASRGSATHALVVRQLQAYIPPTPPSDPIPQIVKVTMVGQDVFPGGIYTFTFGDPLGIPHRASYTATLTDGAGQILAGLIAAIGSSGDSTLTGLQITLDVTTNSMTITSGPGSIGVDAEPGGSSVWWELVPFPFELVDAVIRGAGSDVLKEWGQLQAGIAEEQGVPQEVAIRSPIAGEQRSEAFQSGEKSRYEI